MSADDDSKRPSSVLLVSIFALSLALRCYGIWFGLPEAYVPDEKDKLETALNLPQTGYFHAHHDHHPSFLYNSLYMIFSLGARLGLLSSSADYHLAGRLWMALLGALTVVVSYQIGLFWCRKTALLTAAFVAVIPLHPTASRYIKEHIPLTLAPALTVVAILGYLEKPSLNRLLLMSLAGGFAFSTKFPGLLLAPVVLAVIVYRWRQERGDLRLLAPRLGWAAVLFLLGFLVFSPMYLFYPQSLSEGLTGRIQYSATGHHDGISHPFGRDFGTYYLRHGVLPGMTWPLGLLSILGLFRLARDPRGWLLTLTCLATYLLLELAPAKPAPFPARYLLPAAPLLCLAAARWLVDTATRRSLSARTLAFACLLLWAFPLGKSLLVAHEALNDSRSRAGNWIRHQLPPETTLVMVGADTHPYYFPEPQDPQRRILRWRGPKTWTDPSFRVVLSSLEYQRYLDSPEAVPEMTRGYRRLFQEARKLKEFGPRWLSYGYHSPTVQIYGEPEANSSAFPQSQGAISSAANSWPASFQWPHPGWAPKP